jgi:hypothetical protein
MSDGTNPSLADPARGQTEAVAPIATRPNLKDPRVVLSLLEADQVVAAKRQTHFGRRQLSLGVRVMLWGLRVYVVLMMVIVAISVIHSFQTPH